MYKFKIALLIAMAVMFTSCSTSTTPLVSQNSNNEYNNYKYYPYKSAIIKYEVNSGKNNHKRVRIWDNWGVQVWEEKEDTRGENSTSNSAVKTRIVQFRNNGTLLYANYRHKKIRKSRDLNQDELIVANQDLSKYFIEREFAKAFFYNSDFRKSGKTETIAGKKCNIWASEEIRLCMYEDRIVLKSEAYIRGLKKWVTQQKAVSAKFNVPIDKSLFKLPNFPIEVDSDYISDNQMHKKLREYMKGESELVQRLKARGKEIRDMMNAK